MNKISDYFYIFTKLSTSFVLFLLLIAIGYALYTSYKEVDSVENNLENKLQALKENINASNQKFIDLELLVNNNNNLLSKISDEILNNKNSELLDIQENNKLLLNEINDIKNQISKLDIEKSFNEEMLNNQNKFDDLQLLKDLIVLKFVSGEMVSKEIILLEKFAKETSSNIFEKLYLLEQRKFLGQTRLIKEFDLATEEYIKARFLKDNQSSAIKFFLKYIKIKPSNLNVYESEDLNILFRSKKNLELEEYQDSLNYILMLEFHQDYFEKWINQINLYLDFTSIISKVF
jgi:hypothetical protein